MNLFIRNELALFHPVGYHFIYMSDFMLPSQAEGAKKEVVETEREQLTKSRSLAGL